MIVFVVAHSDPFNTFPNILMDNYSFADRSEVAVAAGTLVVRALAATFIAEIVDMATSSATETNVCALALQYRLLEPVAQRTLLYEANR